MQNVRLPRDDNAVLTVFKTSFSVRIRWGFSMIPALTVTFTRKDTGKQKRYQERKTKPIRRQTQICISAKGKKKIS